MGKSKPVVLSTRTFETRSSAREFFREMLNRYRPGDRVSDNDAQDLTSLLDFHPERQEKVGVGIHHFEVARADYATQCFRVVRTDETWANFSYPTCISNA
jgi:hypothetical protein